MRISQFGVDSRIVSCLNESKPTSHFIAEGW
jgi:hypothetical protein